MTVLDTRPAEHKIEVLPKLSDVIEVTWTDHDDAAVAEAAATFTRYRKAGFMAYTELAAGQGGGVQLHEFDPEAELITMIAPLQGG